ncbi:class I SAM-dependent methyltransferase [Actinokineospora sp. PR83]|uniref:class I SAM-dependent methyltransferase n=1 Tax=Actinokineospora sp. PR83 TaxID=2884908 RepID=UPI001F2C0F4B|nr:class I SAM-dependent methyltransferase [Actinokineospora sp. PR83]MCG8917875.1 class I SAM-dependent methyltransferase [Actinokineospora sp. PR83]
MTAVEAETETTTPLTHRLYAEAFGDDRPAELETFSSCSWWLLGTVVGALKLSPGQLLADIGCGRGGPGLWLARATATRLVGIDFSPAALRAAAARADSFGLLGRAHFQRGSFDATTLEDASVDGAVSVDALPFAQDRLAALTEVCRVLRPGARFVFTGREGASSWTAMVEKAGLVLEDRLVHEGANARWLRLFDLWLRHERELRAELGDAAAAQMVEEARAGHRLVETAPLVFVTRRPPIEED